MSPPRTSRPRRRCRCGSSREPRAAAHPARLGHARRPRPRERPAGDDRAADRRRVDRRGDPGRRLDGARARRAVRAVPVRRAARGRGTLPRIRPRHGGGRERGARGGRHGRDRHRRVRRARDGNGGRDQHPSVASPERARHARARAPARRRHPPGCRARGARHRARARAGAAGARLPGGHAHGARRDAARHRRGGRRDRGRRGGNAARPRPGAEPPLVRGGRARRHRCGLAPVTARGPGRAMVWSLLRLFTVQGSYDYERMQGIGMGVAEEPLLRDLRAAGDGEPGGTAAYRAAVARGARFFNAHPYLCGLAVGAAARAEHEGVPAAHIERLRAALCGPLGSLGDRLVWVGWLPFTSGLALIGVALGLGLPAVLGFLLLYNAGHVALRWWALRAGWAHGAQVAAALHEPLLQRGASVAARAMACVVGAALPLAARYLSGPFGGGSRVALAAVTAAGVGLLWWRRGQLTSLRFGLALLAVATLAGWLWR